jgi:hypothetical protein
MSTLLGDIRQHHPASPGPWASGRDTVLGIVLAAERTGMHLGWLLYFGLPITAAGAQRKVYARCGVELVPCSLRVSGAGEVGAAAVALGEGRAHE